MNGHWPTALESGEPGAAGALAVTVSLAAQQAPKPAVTAVKPAASHAPAATTMLATEQTAVVKQYCADLP